MPDSTFFLLRLNDHIVYLNRIKATLEQEDSFCGTDYHLCKLGQWLYGDGPAQADDIGNTMRAEFDSLLAPHKAFHEASSIALEARNNDDDAARHAAVTRMHVLSNRLVSILLKMDSLARA